MNAKRERNKNPINNTNLIGDYIRHLVIVFLHYQATLEHEIKIWVIKISHFPSLNLITNKLINNEI